MNRNCMASAELHQEKWKHLKSAAVNWNWLDKRRGSPESIPIDELVRPSFLETGTVEFRRGEQQPGRSGTEPKALGFRTSRGRTGPSSLDPEFKTQSPS